MADLHDLTTRMRTFTDDRDWGQFHDPKSLILALVGEVGEVSELFQWLPSQEARDLASTGQLHRRAAEELSDVLLYLVRLADVLGIDLIEAANAKLDHAESRFSPPNVKGIAPSKE